MEWRVPGRRILRIDVYWYPRRRKRKAPPERKRSPEVEEVMRRMRERDIREVEERRRKREAELEAERDS